MQDPILQVYRDDILLLATRHGASDVRVFGSRARGEARGNSDIDLLVKMDQGSSLLDLVALKHDIEDLLARPVDVVTEAALSPYIRDKVLTEASPL